MKPCRASCPSVRPSTPRAVKASPTGGLTAGLDCPVVVGEGPPHPSGLSPAIAVSPFTPVRWLCGTVETAASIERKDLMRPNADESYGQRSRQAELPAPPSDEPPVGASRAKLTMSVHEAAEALGISTTLAYELVRRGELSSVRLGRRILVPSKSLEALIDGIT